MKKQFIVILIALISFEGISQDLNTFFSKADAFFKANVSNGRVAYSKIHAAPSQLNDLLG